MDISSSRHFHAIIEQIKKIDKVVSIAIVGSFIDNSINANDIDLIVLVDKVENCKQALEEVKNHLCDFNLIVCDDSVRIVCENEMDINIASFEVNYFQDRIKNIFENNHIYAENRIWCLGYWLPEMLVYDISRSNIIYDDFQVLTDLKRVVLERNNILIDQIKEECLKEIDYRLSSFKKKVSNDLTTFFIKNSLNMVIIRYAMLISKSFGTSFKDLTELDGFFGKDFSCKLLSIQTAKNFNEIEKNTNGILMLMMETSNE